MRSAELLEFGEIVVELEHEDEEEDAEHVVVDDIVDEDRFLRLITWSLDVCPCGSQPYVVPLQQLVCRSRTENRWSTCMERSMFDALMLQCSLLSSCARLSVLAPMLLCLDAEKRRRLAESKLPYLMLLYRGRCLGMCPTVPPEN